MSENEERNMYNHYKNLFDDDYNVIPALERHLNAFSMLIEMQTETFVRVMGVHPREMAAILMAVGVVAATAMNVDTFKLYKQVVKYSKSKPIANPAGVHSKADLKVMKDKFYELQKKYEGKS